MKNDAKREGITLLLVVLVLSALLAISISIFSLVFGEFRISGEISDSFVAFYAADRGMEKLLYIDRVADNVPGCGGRGACQWPQPPDSPASFNLENGACFRLLYRRLGNGDAIAIAGGEYRCGIPALSVQRAVETTYNKSGGAGAVSFGTGADGDGNAVAATINLNQTSVVGRPNPDAVKFRVGGLSAGTDRIDLGVAPSGLADDDEILVIGLQAPGGGDPIDVGNWETAKISHIAGMRLNLEQPLAKDYPPTTMIQRVPNYNSLVINDNQTYTIDDWTGLPGGVFFIRVKNNLSIGNGGKITVVGRGFRGGDLGYLYYEDPPGCDCWISNWGRAGEGIDGLAPVYDSQYTDPGGALARQPNYGGGGGAGAGRVTGGGGGGYGSGAADGNYEGPEINTFFGCRVGGGGGRQGLAGLTYGGDLTAKLYLGSGGGGGFNAASGGFFMEYGTAGGDGSGILVIYAKNIDNGGEISASGAASQGNPGANPYYSTGGGGSGGSLLIQTDGFVNRGTITDGGGAGGNAQGTGCGTPPTTNGQGGTGGAGVSSVP